MPRASRSSRSGRVLVIQTAFLGDIVLATSFLANLRSLLPGAEIRLLTTPAGGRLLRPNGMGVEPISYDKRGRDRGFGGFVRQARELREFAPELVFCLHRSLRSALLARLSGGEIWGFREAAGSALFHHRVPRAKGAFEAEKNHALLAAWAGESAAGLPLFPRLEASSEEIGEAEELLRETAGTPFAALAPGSVWATKRWPAAHFARLARLLWERSGLRSVLVGGADEAAVGQELLGAYGEGAPAPLNLIGRTSLGGLKAVLARARLVVSNDSSPLHVAVAVGAPALGVFGPTTRELGFFPLAPAGRSAVAELPGLACRPCGLHGHRECPLGHFRCMKELPPERVFERAEELLCR